MIALVARVGAASGARAAAAALACCGSDSGRAGLLIDLGADRHPRPSPIATAAARRIEERLAAHSPDARVASRGQICQLALPGDRSGVERIAAALPIVRDSVAVLHLPPPMLQAVLEEPLVRPSAALLRADLAIDRALTALAVQDLMERGVQVAVLKRPLGWLAGRSALLGALPPGNPALPARLLGRLGA